MQSMINRKVQVPLPLLVLLGIVIIVLAVLVAIGSGEEDSLGGTVAQNPIGFDSGALINNLNTRRAPALNNNGQLTTAAQQWADALAAGGSSDVNALISGAGYQALGWYSYYSFFFGAQSADQVGSAWGGVASLYDAQYADVGIGAASNASGQFFYTVIVAKSAGSGGGGGGGTVNSTPDEQANLILAAVNNARAAQGLCALTLNGQLNAAALAHSQDMANTDTLTHTGSNGSTPEQRIANAGYSGATATGENVLSRFDVNAQGAYDQWWNSPPHQANMLNRLFTDIGISYAGPSTSGAYYYTMVLGSTRGGCP